MTRGKRRLSLLLVTLGGACLLNGCGGEPEAEDVAPAQEAATASDGSPCGPQVFNSLAGQNVTFCPDWSPTGTIPIMRGRTRPFLNVIDHMNHTGQHVNWYMCQQPGDSFSTAGFTNNWWALTIGDGGHIGWVNEVYFRGGGNNQPDGAPRTPTLRQTSGLPLCCTGC